MSCGVPVVATNDVRFVRREDFQSHEARVCIHEGMLLDDPKRPRRYTRGAVSELAAGDGAAVQRYP